MTESMTTRQRVMITGANRGIGLELTRQSAAMGDEVIACCRTRGSHRVDGTGSRTTLSVF